LDGHRNRGDKITRYYVDNSSWFDTHPYNKNQIKNIVKKAGGKNVRFALKFGWSNQPQVVCFNTTKSQLEIIQILLEKELKTPWIIIRKKDW